MNDTTMATAMCAHAETGGVAAERVALLPLQPGWVRVRVAASGVCYADIGTSRGARAGRPVTPGHEIAGVVHELGAGVEGWQAGDRVAVGWFGGSCGHCGFCRAGDVVHCAERRVPGVSYPGGWAEFVAVPADALARIPDGLDDFSAAPLGCAGVTVFNAIRRAELPAGARVAIFGIGGLGHLAVQFAAKLGYEVVAIARGADRAPLAAGLGASRYIDSAATLPGAALRELGGADLILSTAPNTEPLTELVDGLRVRGRLIVVGIDGGSIAVPVARLAVDSLVITGHLTGSALDVEETMRFAQQHGVRPMIERMPLEEAGAAVQRIAAGEPRFRIVLDATSGR